MKTTSKIHSSTEYNIFKYYDGNRQIAEEFVKKLMNSPTFEEGFRFNPIIVNERMIIIDGQHRAVAAMRKKMPIYYVIYEGADENTIIEMNTQMRAWKPSDFSDYYSTISEDYKCFASIREKFFVHISSLIRIVAILSRKDVGHPEFKSGKMKVLEWAGSIIEFCEKYYTMARKHRAIIGVKYSSPLFSLNYVICFCRLFRDNPEKFKKVLDKIDNTCLKFPKTTSPEDIHRIIEMILNGKYKNYLEAI